MKTKILNALSSKTFQIFTAFFVGVGFTYFVTDYINLKSKVSQTQEIEPQRLSSNLKLKDPFSDIDSIHNKMMKRMDKMFDSNMFGSSILGNSFFDSDSFNSFYGGSDISIEESEDDRFKYVTINAEGIDKEALKIDISEGMISISGQIKKVDEDKGNNSFSSSSYVSSFSKSFNVPYGVNGNDAKIENEKNKIIIKFPKDTV